MSTAGGGRPDGGLEPLVARVLGAWVGAVRRSPRLVLAAAGVATAVLGPYAALHLGFNTSHRALFSDDLDFWNEYNEFARVFPILDESLLVVVDAETADRAREAADVLAARLAARPELFSDVYVPGGGEFFERHALLYLSVEELEDLSDDLARVQPLLAEIARDRSLRNLAQVLRDTIEITAADPSISVDLTAAFDSVSQAATAVLEGRPRPVSWTDLLLGSSQPGERSRRLIVAEPVLDYASLLSAREPIRAVREAARELSLEEKHGARVRITGNPALNTEEMVLVARDALIAATGSLVLVGAILLAALRSRTLVFAILVTLLTGLIWTAAFAAFAVGSLNVISIAFAVLFIGLGVDFGIHFGMRYAELVRGGFAHDEALAETSRSVGGSLVLCAITTAVGFYVFVPTDYGGVSELGLISGTGMLVSLLCTLTVLPALLTVTEGAPLGSEWPRARAFTQGLIAFAVRHSRRVRLGAAGVGAVSLMLLPFAHFDHNAVNLRNPSTESVQTFNDLLAESHTSPWTMNVMAPDLEAAVAIAELLRGLDEVERAVTLRDYVPENQEEKLEVLADLALFLPPPPEEGPDAAPPPIADQVAALEALREALRAPWVREDPQRAESAQRAVHHLGRFLATLETLERKQQALDELETSLTGALPDQMQRLWNAVEPGPVTLEGLPPDLRSRMLAADGRALVEVLPSEDLSDNVAHAGFVDTIRAHVPHATGSALTLLEFARAVVRSFQQALSSALIAVAALLWLLWRRLGDMALVLIPLLLAAAVTGALAVLLGLSFNFANIVVLPLLLGIGVDSGIHLVHRHRVALAGDSTSGDLGRELLGTSTAQAVFFSALTTIGSFGTLALSSHPGIAGLGQLLLVGVVATLAANLIVLPALIARREPSARGLARPAAA